MNTAIESFVPSLNPFFQPVISTVLEVPEGQTLYVCYCLRGTLSNETSHVGCGGSSKKLFAFSGHRIPNGDSMPNYRYYKDLLDNYWI